MIFRILKFPNLQNATCCANCRVTAYTNRILTSFYDIELTNAELKNRATRAMGLKQECPNRTAGRHCHALRFKHRMLMIILNEIPLIDPLFAPAPHNTLQDAPEPAPPALVEPTRDTATQTPARPPPNRASCPVCFEPLENAEHTMATTCGHVLCMQCYTTMAQHHAERPWDPRETPEQREMLDGAILLCPVCRKPDSDPRLIYLTMSHH